MSEIEILPVALLSFYIAGSATFLASLAGIPLGAFVALRPFRGSFLVQTGIVSLYALPATVVGLIFYTLLSRGGPLGFLNLVFTPLGMVIAETFFILPLVASLSASAVRSVEDPVRQTIRTLGADEWQFTVKVLREARLGLFAAVMVGFGRAISEVGVVWIVGANISGRTQVLTTAIVEQTQRGEFGTAFALAGILLFIATAVFLLLRRIQERR